MRGVRFRFYLDASWLRLTAGKLLLVFVVVTVGCSQPPPRIAVPPATIYPIEPGTLRAVDERILGAAVYARHESGACARVACAKRAAW